MYKIIQHYARFLKYKLQCLSTKCCRFSVHQEKYVFLSSYLYEALSQGYNAANMHTYIEIHAIHAIHVTFTCKCTPFVA